MSLEFVFLGTCAADFSPLLKTVYRDKFDFDARRASCAIINGRYLLDCGPHCPDSLRIAGFDTRKITDIIITHTHDDHFEPESISYIAKDHKINLWVRGDAAVPDMENVTVKRMKSYEKYEVSDGLSVTGLNANHDERFAPRHLLLELDGKKIFYGMDGGWLLNKTYAHLWKTRLDLCVLDCTCGDYLGDYRMGEHNSIPMIRLMLPSLRTVEAIDEHSLIYISHLAPSLHKSHAETVEICKKDGINVAYDGEKIEI